MSAMLSGENKATANLFDDDSLSWGIFLPTNVRENAEDGDSQGWMKYRLSLPL